MRLSDYQELPGTVRRESAPAGVPLILNYSGKLTVDGAATFDAGFVAGPDDRFADTHSDGDGRGVQVGLTWLEARQILGLPLSEVVYRGVTVDELWGRDGRRLIDRLGGTATPMDRMALVAHFLQRRRRPDAAPPVVAGAATLLSRYHGRISISQLAEQLGFGRQHVHREVAHHLGLPPRTLARLLRFQAATAAIRRGTGLATVAADCGYYDQAHLAREFRALAGDTPSGYATSVQAGPPPAGLASAAGN